MSISQHFLNLRAELANPRWSWGAEDIKGRVIIRAWDDEIKEIGDKRYIRLVNRAEYENRPRRHPGYNQRLSQINAIKMGKNGYILMLTAKRPLNSPRKIESYDVNGLTQIGEIRIIEGDEFGELKNYITIKQFT